MTQEEKQLLLNDLCARLPYETWVQYEGKEWLVTGYGHGRVSLLPSVFSSVGGPCPLVEEIRPYLRPMSSMTEEEIEEYRNLSDEVIGSYGPYHHEFIAHCVRLGIKPNNPHECVDDFLNMEAIDWLLEHHFDYRGLITKGLALVAPEGMY